MLQQCHIAVERGLHGRAQFIDLRRQHLFLLVLAAIRPDPDNLARRVGGDTDDAHLRIADKTCGETLPNQFAILT